MFTQNVPPGEMRGQLVEDLPGAIAIRGGSKDSDMKAWQVKPTGPPASTAVTTVRPLAKWPSTSLNRDDESPSTAGASPPLTQVPAPLYLSVENRVGSLRRSAGHPETPRRTPRARTVGPRRPNSRDRPRRDFRPSPRP